jgi:hypothetical protein
VQALIGKTGKVSLKRRIQEIDLNKLKADTVNRTKALLKDIRMEDIVIVSAGAATFYSWVRKWILDKTIYYITTSLAFAFYFYKRTRLKQNI